MSQSYPYTLRASARPSGLDFTGFTRAASSAGILKSPAASLDLSEFSCAFCIAQLAPRPARKTAPNRRRKRFISPPYRWIGRRRGSAALWPILRPQVAQRQPEEDISSWLASAPASCSPALCKRRVNRHRPLRRGNGWTPAHACRSEEHTSELQSRLHLVCRLLLEKKKLRRKELLARRRIPNCFQSVVGAAENPLS